MLGNEHVKMSHTRQRERAIKNYRQGVKEIFKENLQEDGKLFCKSPIKILSMCRKDILEKYQCQTSMMFV